MFSKGYLLPVTTTHCLMVTTADGFFYHTLKKRLPLGGANFRIPQIYPKARMLINAGHCLLQCLTQSWPLVSICPTNATTKGDDLWSKKPQLFDLSGKKEQYFQHYGLCGNEFYLSHSSYLRLGDTACVGGAGINLSKRTKQVVVASLPGC